MALRKASAYSKKRARPFTRRSRSKKKAYIKTVPTIKIAKFHMGNLKAFQEGKHTYMVKLIADERVQIRDNSLEACRMYVNKMLDKNALGQYYFAVNVYPHHILRENKTAAGAGADRLSSGMKHSYGITIGRAAIVNAGKDVFFISCENEKSARVARDALQDIKAKLPCRSRILFQKVQSKIPVPAVQK
ncbi:MAG: 50S ribosomal protein L16 [Nanoarchaeota archaeon]|nr:50S ribosomal protein L16 [Nanoarchaeota archaeon]